MEIISTIAEFDQDKQERYVKVKLYDNELDVFREGMTAMLQDFTNKIGQKPDPSKADKDLLKRIEKAKNEIDSCWKMANPS